MQSVSPLLEHQILARALRAKSIVRLVGVSRSFALGHTTVHALKDISVEIGQGEMVAIWGPSGSGKSTLLNMIGLIDHPDAGAIAFDDLDVRSLSDDALSDCRNRKIGFVFQNFNLIPVMSALENVMLPLQLQLQGMADAVARRIAANWLGKVGLGSLMEMRPDRLSGGQRQRVAIARALAIDPILVIADEPTANLDSENSRAVIDLMQRMNKETGVTFIFSTHDQRLLDRVPRHLLLKDGMLAGDGRLGTGD
ncbi:ABC transporter ATP-binding protein [Sulfuritalea sp.]|uniref:ABC transporter ATP-binding protein n=1 Tax=Sulfuritalea sp. TaxID=2480090 RepID=UPI00286E7E4F|nr:ABC transporter ATP-binding protein [Sulfuritalea sp.]